MTPLLQVRNLTKDFPRQSGMWGDKLQFLRAVDNVSFDIAQGESLGLVGESGSGKSTTGRLILRLLEASSGEVTYDGHDVFALSGSEMRNLRRSMQIVFQDPYGAFNPRMTVANILGEALELRGLRTRIERDAEIERLLETVQMPTDIGSRYPHEFSGGQRQRIGIARALAVQPKFVVLDEPLSALDVSTQAEIVNLLLDLQKQLNLTTLFISHDLSVVRVLCDRVAVLYAGRILELASTQGLFSHPLQPYTQELLAAVPVADPQRARREQTHENEAAPAGDAPGDAELAKPSPKAATAAAEAVAEAAAAAGQAQKKRQEHDDQSAATPVSVVLGCPYAGRCEHVMPICREIMPPLVDYGPRLAEPTPHYAACHWVEERLHAAPQSPGEAESSSATNAPIKPPGTV